MGMGYARGAVAQTFPQLDAAGAARTAEALLSEERGSLLDAWRFGLKQLVDDYETALRHEGQDAAARLFADSPPPSGSCQFDAALAALTEHLARRDGWTPPAWAFEPHRYAQPWWFVDGLESLRATALVDSPAAFRKRGVFICDGALTRV